MSKIENKIPEGPLAEKWSTHKANISSWFYHSFDLVFDYYTPKLESPSGEIHKDPTNHQ